MMNIKKMNKETGQNVRGSKKDNKDINKNKRK